MKVYLVPKANLSGLAMTSHPNWEIPTLPFGQLWDLLSFQYWDFMLYWVLETITSTRMALPIIGTWRIQWDEISSVEIGEVDGTLVFHGSNKRFILAPPTPKLSRTTAYKIG